MSLSSWLPWPRLWFRHRPLYPWPMYEWGYVSWWTAEFDVRVPAWLHRSKLWRGVWLLWWNAAMPQWRHMYSESSIAERVTVLSQFMFVAYRTWKLKNCSHVNVPVFMKDQYVKMNGPIDSPVEMIFAKRERYAWQMWMELMFSNVFFVKMVSGLK